MKNLIGEIHRRSLWQVLGIYAAASWVVLQIVDTLAGALGLPDWAASLALFLLIIGLPIVLATAFVQQGLTTRAPEAPPQPLSEVGETPPAPAPEPTKAQGLLTWRNAMIGGVGAFALLGVAAAGWFGTRAIGIGPAATLVAQGVLEERDQVVVADFESPLEEPDLGKALTEALRIELGNSHVLDVVDGSAVTQALQRMQRDPRQGVDRGAALELAVREGYKAVIAGEVRRLASGYQLSADILQASDGTSLAGFRETARDADGLIDAIDAMSRNIRQKAGESIRSARGGEPLAQVSTGSLEALHRYSEGTRAFDLNDFQRSRTLLEEAVALDTGFAMAYRKLGAVNQNLGETQGLIDGMSAAYRHRARLTRIERLHVAGAYHNYVTGDIGAAILAFEELVTVDPTDVTALNNLAVVLGGSDLEREADLFAQSLNLDREGSSRYGNLSNLLLILHREDEAFAVLDEGAQRFPDVAYFPLTIARAYEAVGEFETARDVLAGLAEGFGGSYQAGAEGPYTASVIDIETGRIGRAFEVLLGLEAYVAENGPVPHLYAVALAPAFAELYTRRSPEAAKKVVAAALDRLPLDSFDPGDRGTLVAADALARAGDVPGARTLLGKWEADRVVGDPSPPRVELTRAFISLAAGDVQEAIDEFARLSTPAPNRCQECALFGLGLAYERAGLRDSAIDAYESFAEWQVPLGFRNDAYTRAYATEQLATLYDARAREGGASERADLEAALHYYERFAELWAEADAEFQPRVRTVRARVEEIRAVLQ